MIIHSLVNELETQGEYFFRPTFVQFFAHGFKWNLMERVLDDNLWQLNTVKFFSAVSSSETMPIMFLENCAWTWVTSFSLGLYVLTPTRWCGCFENPIRFAVFDFQDLNNWAPMINSFSNGERSGVFFILLYSLWKSLLQLNFILSF